MRHTFATRAFEKGVSAKTVQSVLGHADVSLTLNTYTHVLHERLNDEMEKMNDIFIETTEQQIHDKQGEEKTEKVA